MQLTPEDLERYRRQMMMDGWGERTQSQLKASTVFVAGAGGLGSPASIYLAVAGVGRLIVCDFDGVELSNLNRQILHDASRLGVNKAASARATLQQLNAEPEVVALDTRITAENVDELVADSHVIVDCMDNFETRYALNDSAIRKGIPLVHGSVYGFDGRLSFVHAPETACLRCIFPAAPPKEVFPVIGATPGVIGALQAMEAVKYLTKLGKNLKGRLLVWDGGSMEFHSFRTERDPKCTACGGLGSFDRIESPPSSTGCS
jgi:molybdopterin/thiamine biosynthesis adenylyltransferase